MMIRARRPPTWPVIILLGAANLVLAVDSSAVVGIPPITFSIAYTLTAALLLAWRVTGNRELLSVLGGLITVTAGTRAVMFAVFTDRNSGSAVNVLVAVYGFAWMLTQTETETR